MLLKKHRKLFDVVICDEFHEYSTDGSAQERALHRLTEAIPLVLPLTGSLGQKVTDEPETWLWTDEGGDRVRVELRGGRVSASTLERAAEAPPTA